MAESIPEDLISGTPVLERRWRLQNGALPLKNRHMRALQACGLGIGLMSWARQHIEWTLRRARWSCLTACSSWTWTTRVAPS